MCELRKLISVLCILLFLTFVLVAQEAAPESEPETEIEIESVEQVQINPLDNIHVHLENKMIIALSVPGAGVGFGETLNAMYSFPFGLSLGLEAGYYGFRGEIEGENSAETLIGSFSVVPMFITASYDFFIFEGFSLSPMLKGGAGYLRSRVNGWDGGEGFTPVFEGGVKVRANVIEDLWIQGTLTYTGIIEQSGLFSILNIGFGFGF